MKYVILKDNAMYMACSSVPQNMRNDPDLVIGVVPDGEEYSALHNYQVVDGVAIKGDEIPVDVEAEEEMEAYLVATQYQRDREIAYPSFAHQFDILYHGGYDAWKATIDAVKNQYPKP